MSKRIYAFELEALVGRQITLSDREGFELCSGLLREVTHREGGETFLDQRRKNLVTLVVEERDDEWVEMTALLNYDFRIEFPDV